MQLVWPWCYQRSSGQTSKRGVPVACPGLFEQPHNFQKGGWKRASHEGHTETQTSWPSVETGQWFAPVSSNSHDMLSRKPCGNTSDSVTSRATWQKASHCPKGGCRVVQFKSREFIFLQIKGRRSAKLVYLDNGLKRQIASLAQNRTLATPLPAAHSCWLIGLEPLVPREF